MLSAFFAASTQPSCPLEKFSPEVIQVTAARMALDLGTTESKSRMWPMLTSLGAWTTFFSNLGKILKPLPKFLFAVIPKEALSAVHKT